MRTTQRPAVSADAVVRPARFPQDESALQALLQDYVGEFRRELGNQLFDLEMWELPQRYGPPDAAMLVAEAAGAIVGCAAVKRLRGADAELKRMVVARGSRGQGLGMRLAAEAVHQARAMGFRTLYLDTMPSMVAARVVYGKLGFVECPPYYATSPLESPIFMRLDL